MQCLALVQFAWEGRKGKAEVKREEEGGEGKMDVRGEGKRKNKDSSFIHYH